MYAMYRNNLHAIGQVAAILAVAVIAVAAYSALGEPGADRVPGATSTKALTIGVATGETVNGVPVYRFPPISVTASRKVELAKIAQEDAAARAKRDHAKISAAAPRSPCRKALRANSG